MADLSTTFIVPVYNEETRLPGLLDRILQFMDARYERSELIFVDDGSVDNTAAILRHAVGNRDLVRVLRYEENRGKGGAIREGMKVSRNDIVFFMDIDLSVPLRFVDKFLEKFAESDADIVIGSRRAPGANIATHQSWVREQMGRVFTGLSRALVPGITDFTCGLKAFRNKVGKILFSSGLVDDWSFDTEILYLAHRAACRIEEVPVEWRHVPGSKVKAVPNALVCLYQLVAIPLRYRIGKYGALKYPIDR